MKSRILVEKDPETQSCRAVEIFQSQCHQAIARQGRFTVALSGGESPKKFYEKLASLKLPWEKIHFFWGDERCVPPDDPKSNYKMATDLFLSKISIPEKNIHRMPGELQPEKAAEQYERELELFFVNPPKFDFNLLGLGTNGHTASLFPNTKVIKETVRWVVGYYVDEVKMSRLTLTVPILNQSRLTLFLVSGQEKADVVREVIEGPPETDRLPAQLIQPNSSGLIWLLDQPAASQLAS